ncbi:MAG TPA: hypothetical protein VJM79_02565 [Rhizorhapis sp.]|nr:hypothetical protein [Rhizorhapis sp.]
MNFTARLALGAFVVAALSAPVWAQDGVNVLGASVSRLLRDAGVYNVSKTGSAPSFVADPSWPQPLPNRWILGQVAGLHVDQHNHIWVYNRARTSTNEEVGSEAALPGVTNAEGVPINGLGFPRPFGTMSDCCNAAPAVMEFDASGKLLRSWGGPSDRGFIGGKCKAEDGCLWPNGEHGIYVDQQDNVWLTGNANPPAAPGAAPAAGRGAPAGPPPWRTNKEGGDGFLLKFDRDGNFKLRVGGTPRGPNSNDTDGGINGTPLLYRATDMVRDPRTNRLYIADGYGNRHVLVIDADTGKFIGSFGAYGNNPIDDAAAAAAGPFSRDYAKGNRKPAFFRPPVHCVKLAEDGKLYVCDRGNNRIQVFDTRSPDLGRPCTNPGGEAGRCGFVAEQFLSEKTNTGIPGTAVSVSFSSDRTQSCLYVGDNSNMTIYILNRSNLQELGRLGRSGKQIGQFHWLHTVATDGNGNIYTAEVDTGKRIQKFLRYGQSGCSGTGFTTIGPVP